MDEKQLCKRCGSVGPLHPPWLGWAAPGLAVARWQRPLGSWHSNCPAEPRSGGLPPGARPGLPASALLPEPEATGPVGESRLGAQQPSAPRGLPSPHRPPKAPRASSLHCPLPRLELPKGSKSRGTESERPGDASTEGDTSPQTVGLGGHVSPIVRQGLGEDRQLLEGAERHAATSRRREGQRMPQPPTGSRPSQPHSPSAQPGCPETLGTNREEQHGPWTLPQAEGRQDISPPASTHSKRLPGGVHALSS